MATRPPSPRDLASNLRTGQIIVLAQGAGLFVFLAIVVAVRQGAPAGQSMIALIGLLFTGMMIVVRLFVRHILNQQMVRMAAEFATQPSSGLSSRLLSDEQLQEKAAALWGPYFTRLIISVALLEGAAFFNLIAYMIEGQWYSLAVTLLLLAGVLLHFPTRQQFLQWAEEILRHAQ